MAEHETPFRYDAALADRIETAWQARWERDGAYRVGNPGDAGFDASKPKFYVLDMFPYPSGAGLHVGHPEGYTATDIVARFKRMRGFNVLHPMGWDAFGLPAEQYAVQTGVHPRVTTTKAIDNFRRQLKRFGFCYDWSREFGTIDEGYVRFTQWIWLQAYGSWYDPKAGKARPISELEAAVAASDEAVEVEGGATRKWSACTPLARQRWLDGRRLAYLGEQTVNWCPKLGTVLANEEVIDGRSERGGHPVKRLPLRQWMFRITAYADRLVQDLALVDWPESTRVQQAEWIGRSEGAEIDFAVEGFGTLRVFTTRPDTLFGATYMVLAPEHALVQAVAHGAGSLDAAARAKGVFSLDAPVSGGDIGARNAAELAPRIDNPAELDAAIIAAALEASTASPKAARSQVATALASERQNRRNSLSLLPSFGRSSITRALSLGMSPGFGSRTF